MFGPLRPRHFADVHQALDALLQFNKRAVVGHADYAPMHVRTYWITMFGIEPRIGRELLKAKRHALLVAIEL